MEDGRGKGANIDPRLDSAWLGPSRSGPTSRNQSSVSEMPGVVLGHSLSQRPGWETPRAAIDIWYLCRPRRQKVVVWDYNSQSGLIFLRVGMVAASITSRYRDSEGRIESEHIKFGERKVRKFSENSAKSRVFFSFGTSRPGQNDDPRDDNNLSFFQHLPPKELREEEYILSALMANSR